MQKENELKETKERLEQHEKVVADLDRQYAQAMEEKNILAEQLQEETELCAEAEEMRARYILYYRHNTTETWKHESTFSHKKGSLAYLTSPIYFFNQTPINIF